MDLGHLVNGFIPGSSRSSNYAKCLPFGCCLFDFEGRISVTVGRIQVDGFMLDSARDLRLRCVLPANIDDLVSFQALPGGECGLAISGARKFSASPPALSRFGKVSHGQPTRLFPVQQAAG